MSREKGVNTFQVENVGEKVNYKTHGQLLTFWGRPVVLCFNKNKSERMEDLLKRTNKQVHS